MKLRNQNEVTYPILFLLTFSSDHITGATGKTPTLTISKNGAAFASPVGTVAEVANGWYKWTPNTADFDTKGELVLHATAADCDPYDEKYEIGGINFFDTVAGIPAAVWNYATASAGAVTTFGGYLLSKLNIIGTSTAYALSPTPQANTIRIVRGDAYAAADGRQIDLVYSGQPDFTSATNVTLKAVKSLKDVGTTVATWSGSVVNSTTLRFTPESTDSDDLPALSDTAQVVYPFEVSLTLASGKVITPTSLSVGRLVVDQQAA